MSSGGAGSGEATVPTGEPVLVCDAISRSFGGIAALHDVSLSVHRGEFVALLGPNGAGKSTLLGALAGWIHPSSGEILLHGHAVQDQRLRHRVFHLDR